MENTILEIVTRQLEEKKLLIANNKVEWARLLQKLKSEKLSFRGKRGLLLVRQASQIMEFNAIYLDMWSRIKEDNIRELAKLEK